MEKQDIFPAEFMAMTTEYHFHKYNPKTNLIYRMVLAIIVLAVLAMFFIKVDVNVKSAGMVTSTTGHDDIKTLVSARVDSVLIKENMPVKKGQVLVVLKAAALSQEDIMAQTQQAEYSAQLADLQKLAQLSINNKWTSKPPLTSQLYSQQYVAFLQRVRGAAATAESARRNYNRYAYLYKNHAISSAEFDAVDLANKNASSTLQSVYEEQGSRWQADLANLQIRMRSLSSTGEGLKEQKDYYTLRAPIAGVVQNVKGIQPGSTVTAGEILAEISPDNGLIAEAYVQPKDIGYLKPNVKVNFLIDAFNYREWGKLTGNIISVSSDVFGNTGQQPYFKVRCKLDADQLKLRNGYVGRLKKGMTLQANFRITRRTLFQLLYDKADNWLNPGKIMTEDQTKNS
ncbi:HlyD family secretion protein [Mucilaginibacter myungsuensis]|uniref:HlyD family efflux transporter periplasmic adaptor subunit n=1 Tax=Mucilaginibacter myungsuensis TaxID=649104 RepID=A0A929KVB5_9SPHI|nr:HlyD family efflux transporter periplasmic adaptor subunit [Mucilaginibacter myungsuensis]MBE9661412.1 HlyD family efflux transporter periplasmic adaptor subunit [Mucilaginibacter myungsuensis]MDN3597555.1 HlyD family efflux transporter periplasmic adaptor subunit [Mucilaginibacter myungsuensis]